MFCKVFVTVFLVFLIQDARSTNVEEILSNWEPKITTAKETIRRTTERSSNTISNTHIAIDNIVRTGSTSVYKQLSDLEEVVNQEVRPGRNISHCIEELDNSKDKLDIQTLQNCRDSPKWNEIGNTYAELIILELSVTSSPNNCFAQYGVSAEHLDECILSTINQSVEKSATIFKEIGTSIGEIRNIALNCVHSATIPLRVSIDTISRNFKTCVNSV